MRSRLSTNRIVFTGPQAYQDFSDAFIDFFAIDGTKNKRLFCCFLSFYILEWTAFIKSFVAKIEVEAELKYIYQATRST